MRPSSSQWIPIKLTSSPTSFYSSILRFNPTSTFFEVTFNRTLSFSKHASSLKAKCFLILRPNAVYLLPHKALLSSYSLFCVELFFGLILTCASFGWFSFLSSTNTNKLERLHQAASRLITGCFSPFSISLLLFKASLPLLRVTLTHFALSFYERALCFPTSFPF